MKFGSSSSGCEPRPAKGEARDTQRGTWTCVDLGRLHALQVVSEYCASKHSFYGYELNLVLGDGSRVNVVDHGDLGRIRLDGEALSQFLSVPMWDSV